MGILIDMLFGSTSPFALDVYESGLVNGFEAGYDHGRSSSIVYLEGETDDPEAVYTKFLSYLEENRKAGFPARILTGLSAHPTPLILKILIPRGSRRLSPI